MAETAVVDFGGARARQRHATAVGTAFVSGALCAMLVFTAAALSIRRWPQTFVGIQQALGLRPPLLTVPAEVLAELRQKHAVIDNAEDLTPQREHETILTRLDLDLDFTLRPSVRVRGDVLPAQGDLNLDPPVVYRRADTVLSERATE